VLVVTSTVSGLIYGQKEGETATNETGGKEPLSGTQGKGTANEPFDQGNAENPVDTSSTTNTAKPATGNTSYSGDDFLKLDPVINKPTTDTTTTTGTTGSTDKAGASEQVWKPTDIDEVKPSGAPGAGPEAPDYKVATPDLSSKTTETPADTTTKSADTPSETKKTDTTETTHTDAKAQPPVGGPIQEVLEKGTAANTEHTVDESEVEDPHSKMSDKTHRATTANKTGESGEVETHAAEKTTTHTSESSKPSESSKAAGPSSPGGDEKSEKKMDKLKDKLKNKLHIGSKDK